MPRVVRLKEMPSALHGKSQSFVLAWLGVYAEITNGMYSTYPETDIKVDDRDSFLVPDILLYGPESIVEGTIVKNPALVVEVAVNSVAKDRGKKKD